jgi:hypothetical protein
MGIMGLSLLSVSWPSVLPTGPGPQDLSDHRRQRKPFLAITNPSTPEVPGRALVLTT